LATLLYLHFKQIVQISYHIIFFFNTNSTTKSYSITDYRLLA